MDACSRRDQRAATTIHVSITDGQAVNRPMHLTVDHPSAPAGDVTFVVT